MLQQCKNNSCIEWALDLAGQHSFAILSRESLEAVITVIFMSSPGVNFPTCYVTIMTVAWPGAGEGKSKVRKEVKWHMGI